MEIADAIERFFQHLLVERGVSNQTIADYREDLEIFIKDFPDKKTTDDFLPSDPNDFMVEPDSVSDNQTFVNTFIEKLGNAAYTAFDDSLFY